MKRVKLYTLNVEDVEVIKGPAALEYGNEAIAGVIKINNNNLPAKHSLSGEAKALYQSINDNYGIGFNLKQFNFSKDIADLKLEKEDNNLFLRIVIDRDEIIDIDKCVEVTNIINPLLDEKDLIKESYILDVSTKEKGR